MTRTSYICQRCALQILRQPFLRQRPRTTTVQRRDYAALASTDPAAAGRVSGRAEHASKPLPDHENPTSSLSKLIAASTPRRGGRLRPNRPSKFRLKKHLRPDLGTLQARQASLEENAVDGQSPKVEPLSVGLHAKVQAELTPSPPSEFLVQRPRNYTRLDAPELQDCHWYWETLAPTVAQKIQATNFFVHGAAPRFLTSVATFRQFPESDVPEVAFVGRSNVGKSSLLNAVVNTDIKALLAKTSSTPGFTKTMNLYGAGPGNGVNLVKSGSGHGKIVGRSGITIVDMPGYGEGSHSEWGYEIMKYLQGRKQLRRVFVLIDAEHGIKEKDRSLLASLRMGGISHQIILSKLDKVYIPKPISLANTSDKSRSKEKPRGSLEALKRTMNAIRSEVQPPMGGGALGEILGCSSAVVVDKRKLGVDAVRFAILQAAGLELRFQIPTKREKAVERLVSSIHTGNSS